MTYSEGDKDWPFAFAYGEHGVAWGSTGSGKTTMVRDAILARRKRFIVVDSEADVDGTSFDFSSEAFLTVSDSQAISIAAGNKNFRLRIPMDVGDRGLERMEALCHGLLYKGAHDFLFYLDECTDFSDAHSIGENLSALARKGRKRHISVVAGSQKPAGLNAWYVDNAIHRFVFGMMPDDAIRYAKRTGQDIVLAVQPSIPLGSHKFAYIDYRGSVTVFRPVPLFDWDKLARRVKK